MAAAQDVDVTSEQPAELRVRVQTRNLASMRRNVEPRLTENMKTWRIGAIREARDPDGLHTAEYHVQLKKKATPDDLLALLRASGSDQVINVELL